MLPVGSVGSSSWLANPEALSASKNAAAAADSAALGQGATGATGATGAAGSSAAQPASFSTVLANAVNDVNSTMQAAETAKSQVLSGETNNVHQSMIAVQESNVAFSLMVEVRNKLVDSYQELMRMQV
jgi:flagellar hook-basal body complex protein FliE